MTVTRDQAQMLATLAIACRPTGARQWNAEGVMAEIHKLADRSLGEVILAVTRAALDRDAQRPQIITSAGSHWQDTRIAQGYVPLTMDPSERCSICSMTEASCRIRHSTDDHEFESAAMAARRKAESAPEAVATVIAALHDEVAATPRRDPPPTGLAATDKPGLQARLDALLETNTGLRAAPMQEPTMEEA